MNEKSPTDKTLGSLARLAVEDDAQAKPPTAPLSAAETDAIADAVFARLGIAAPQAPAAPAPAASADPGARVLAFPARRKATWIGIGVPLALAAGLTVFVFRPRPPGLTAYEVELAGSGAQVARGPAAGRPPPGAAPAFAPGNTVELRLRPATRVEGAVHVAAYVVRGEAVSRLQPTIESDPSGAFRLTLKVGPAPLDAPGPAELLMVVTPAALPDASGQATMTRPSLEAAVADGGGRLLSQPVVLLADAPGASP